jgi:dinuclear metal center YbgI/SA1388 family protein
MSLTVTEVGQQIDAFAPRDWAASWDPVGLQIGDPGATVEAMAVCHEVDDEVVGAIESAPVDLLVTYHPVLFHPTRSFIAGPTATGRAYRLARTGTSVGVVHTAFDSAPRGTADALADLIGLTDRSGFFPAWGPDTIKVVTFVPSDNVDAVADAMTAAGAGTIGNYTACSFRSKGIGTFTPGEGANPSTGEPGAFNTAAEIRIEMLVDATARDAVIRALVEAHPYETPTFDVYSVESTAAMIGRIGTLESHSVQSLAGAIGDALDVTVRAAGTAEEVHRVAVLPGSGGSAIDAAAAAGADVLVTGDIDHHQAHRALDLGMAIIDAGHAATEKPGIRRLYSLVSGIGPETVDLTFIDPSPWEEVAWRSSGA